MNNHLVNPVLSNYLVPRNERFKQDFMNNQMSYSESHWGKKSEKTTNISEMPYMSSNLESPEPYSLNQSLQDDTLKYYENSREMGDFYRNPKRQKRIAYKMERTFELEDSDGVPEDYYPNNGLSKQKSFETFQAHSNNLRFQPSKIRARGDFEQNQEYQQFSRTASSKYNDQNRNQYGRSRGYSTGRVNMDYSRTG